METDIAHKYFFSLRYFTLWTIVLTLAHKWTSDVFNLELLVMITFIGGMYIAFVYPRYYKIQFSTVKVKVNNVFVLFLIEAMIHFCLLLYVLQKYGGSYKLFGWETLNSFLLILVYCLLVDLDETYDLRGIDVARITSLVVLLHFASRHPSIHSKLHKLGLHRK